MDDFKVVLGLEFHDLVKAISMPFANSLCITEGDKVSVVPTTRGTKQDLKVLSALQFKKGIKMEEESYLAILSEFDDDEPRPQDDMPKEVAAVLEEFKDVSPAVLPKKLPPRREIGHEIELEPGTKPPAMGTYCMALLELAELRRQLKELLDAGFIRHSKAPFGAPRLERSPDFVEAWFDSPDPGESDGGGGEMPCGSGGQSWRREKVSDLLSLSSKIYIIETQKLWKALFSCK
ncbi:hypothetical protein ACLB2K_016771 [Fragaria x ananassa]